MSGTVLDIENLVRIKQTLTSLPRRNNCILREFPIHRLTPAFFFSSSKMR